MRILALTKTSIALPSGKRFTVCISQECSKNGIDSSKARLHHPYGRVSVSGKLAGWQAGELWLAGWMGCCLHGARVVAEVESQRLFRRWENVE